MGCITKVVVIIRRAYRELLTFLHTKIYMSHLPPEVVQDGPRPFDEVYVPVMQFASDVHKLQDRERTKIPEGQDTAEEGEKQLVYLVAVAAKVDSADAPLRGKQMSKN